MPERTNLWLANRGGYPFRREDWSGEPAKLLDVRYDDFVVSATQERPTFEHVFDRPVPPDEERVLRARAELVRLGPNPHAAQTEGDEK